MPDDRVTASPPTHECCWHPLNFSYTVSPPITPERCCHCGVERTRMPEPLPIPDGHGPFYPRSFTTITFR